MHRSRGVVIVQLESLNKATVQDSRGQWREFLLTTPADDSTLTIWLHVEDRAGGDFGPWKMAGDKAARYSVEDQVFSAREDVGWDRVDGSIMDPRAEFSSNAGGIGRGGRVVRGGFFG